MRNAALHAVHVEAHSLQQRLFVIADFEQFSAMVKGQLVMMFPATVDHVKQCRPDIFFTTVSYPIKGTPYYKSMSDRLVQLKPWSTFARKAVPLKTSVSLACSNAPLNSRATLS